MRIEYEWDVAISLCKQDIEFARKLVKNLNPNLKVFFYEDRQEELISKSGPEKFAQIFKEQSRVVVVLSREEWSNSYYTDIERNAIIDRTAVKNEGYHFLMIIPLVKSEIPPWYPSTQIYADPFNFNISELAHFIEFKITEEGGVVKTLTFEDHYQNMLNRIAEKQSVIKLQSDENSINCVKGEIIKLREIFNMKSELLLKNNFVRSQGHKFYDDGGIAFLSLGEYLINVTLEQPNELYQNTFSTQNFSLTIEMSKIIANNLEYIEPLEIEKRIFYYTPEYQGWAIPIMVDLPHRRDFMVLFRDRFTDKYYDLKDPLRTEILVDNWFQKLLRKSTKTIESYLR